MAMLVRFPCQSEISLRLQEARLGSYEPATTVYLCWRTPGQEMTPEVALWLVNEALLAAAAIEGIAPTPSTGIVVDRDARTRMVIEALFDSAERDAIMEVFSRPRSDH